MENSRELTKSLQITLLIIRLNTHAQYVTDYGFKTIDLKSSSPEHKETLSTIMSNIPENA